MFQRKNDIASCIQSTLLGDAGPGRQEHIELHHSLKVLQAEKQQMLDALQLRETELAERRAYLRSLSTSAAVARQEVPQLRHEVGALKDKLLSLTFDAVRWEETCTRQERTIERLTQKQVELQEELTEEKQKLQQLEDLLGRTDEHLSQLSQAVERYERARERLEIETGCGQGQAAGNDVGSAGDQDVAQLIDEMAAMMDTIKDGMQERTAIAARETAMIAANAQQQEEISAVGRRIDRQNEKITGLQEKLDQLTAANRQRNDNIVTLREKYQLYDQLMMEDRQIRGQYNTLVMQVNQVCDELRTGLVLNSRLDLSLRLEDLKMNLLLKELEKIG